MVARRTGALAAATVAMTMAVTAAPGTAGAGQLAGSAGRPVTATVLGGPGRNFSGTHINERGEVVGVGKLFGRDVVGLYTAGRFRTLVGPLSSKTTVVADSLHLNERGDVAGALSTTVPGQDRPRVTAFLWSRGRLIDLGVIGLTVSGLSERGQVLLTALSSDVSSVVWDNGVIRAAPTLPGGVSLAPYVMNGSGMVAGLLWQGGPLGVALWQPGGDLTTLDTPADARLLSLTAISDDGTVVVAALGASYPVTLVGRAGTAMVDIGRPPSADFA
jgi:hypothetical protein